MSWLPATSGALAIACGAFGAHALKGRVDDRGLEVWQTAASYHLAHSLAMLAVDVGNKARSKPGAPPAGVCGTNKLFAAGTALFSGSLYLLVLTGYKKVGIVTPIGGLTLIAGWLSMAF